MRALASHYATAGGALWIAGSVAGMIATRPVHGAVWEICRLYVHPSRHGDGLAHALLDTAEAQAASHGATVMELWSDTRFLRAHRFYGKRGYMRGGRRLLHDLSHTEEWRFARG